MKKSNKYIEIICNHLEKNNITYELEYYFAKPRRFRFDIVLPLYNIGVEYEGIFQGKSRHTTLKGYTDDCTKYNLAIERGYKVLRYTALHFANNGIYKIMEQIIDLINQNRINIINQEAEE